MMMIESSLYMARGPNREEEKSLAEGEKGEFFYQVQE